MHARTFTFQVRPGALGEAVGVFRGSLESVRALGGFRRALLLVDRTGGRATTLTLWESEAALRASGERAAQLVAGAAQYMDGAPERREYEVALDTDAL